MKTKELLINQIHKYYNKKDLHRNGGHSSFIMKIMFNITTNTKTNIRKDKRMNEIYAIYFWTKHKRME